MRKKRRLLMYRVIEDRPIGGWVLHNGAGNRVVFKIEVTVVPNMDFVAQCFKLKRRELHVLRTLCACVRVCLFVSVCV